MNHTSSDHEWFQESRKSPDNPKRDWYVWSDTVHKYEDARIIFTDTETSNWTWDEQAGAYFWHRFFSHQPDLNFDNPEVQEAMLEVMRFWLDLGLDGFRLDAVPYLFEREGTNGENLPETHEYLRRIRAEIDAHYPDRVLLAEANQWPADVVEYFGDGDECHMAFHFPVMPRMFMAVRREEATPIYEILAQTPAIPENCQWGLFLRNHDELTLEMVTDEERDYMYSEYAKDPRMKINVGIRKRLAPLLDNGRDEIELMNAILFSLPGSPVLYYGDEIAMGDNVFLGDRDGVRTPMQWTGDRNGGFSRADFAQLYAPPLMDPVYGYQAVNVEAQLRHSTSLLRWMRRFIAMRKEHPVFGLGTYEPLTPSNGRIFAHIRRYEDDLVLCVHNMARSAQAVELDLSEYEGRYPIELFGRSRFPRIGELPYLLTLAPRGFYWFQLAEAEVAEQRTGEFPALVVERARERWSPMSDLLATLDEDRLREWFIEQRWFGSKTREIAHLNVLEAVTLRDETPRLVLALIEVRFPSGTHEVYQVPIGVRPDDEEWTERVIAEVDGLTFYDALADPAHARELLHLMRSSVDVQASDGTLGFRWSGGAAEGGTVEVRPVGVEQSNSSIVFGETLILKAFRRVEPGVNPELELLRFLSERDFPHIAPIAGWYQYEGRLMDATLGRAAGVPGRRDRRLGPRARRALRRPRGVPRQPARARRRDRRAAHGARLGGVGPGLRPRAAEHRGAGDPHRDDRRGDRADLRRAARPRGARSDPRPRPGRPGAPADALQRGRGRAHHPHPRRLPPRPDHARRARLGAARLRGRARAPDLAAAPEALAAARRRGDAALLQLRGGGLADPARPAGARGLGGPRAGDLPRRATSRPSTRSCSRRARTPRARSSPSSSSRRRSTSCATSSTTGPTGPPSRRPASSACSNRTEEHDRGSARLSRRPSR